MYVLHCSHLPWLVALVLLIGSTWSDIVAGQPAAPPRTADSSPVAPLDVASPEFRIRVEQLIDQLGSDTFATREAATEELRGIGVTARVMLERATRNDDREIAQRATALVAGFPKLTHTIADALGAPIPFARVVVTITRREPDNPASGKEEARRETTTTDELGRIGVPEFPPNETRCVVRVEQPEYGVARSDVDLTGSFKTIRLPLLRAGSDARTRAVSGKVVTVDGRPVAGAVIQCGSARTPGEGLINGLHPRGDSLTDEQGNFVYYLPNENPGQERGDLIPVNSHYELSIDVPDDDSVFPTAGRFTNAAPARIELAQPTTRHRFRWESAAGGFLEKPEQLPNIHVDYLQAWQGDQRRIRLSSAFLARGRRVLNGTYSAMFFDNGKTIQFEPLIVNSDSPEELVFRLPPAVTFSGRVTHGVTNEPLRNGLVIGWNSTGRNNLALLTADEWKTLRDAPADPPADHPATRLMTRFYGMQALSRTDAEGRFEIVQRPDQRFYGLLAFDEDFVPFRVHVGSLKPNADRRIDVGTLPLFPAARILVRPVFEKGQISVSPHWQLADEEQPSWVGQLRAIQRGSERDFETTHWLTLNETQPLYVPADVCLRLRFEVPYHDRWNPPVVDATIRLDRGGTQDIGALEFSPSLPVVVRVVNPAGQPVEGFAVRRFHERQNSWSVAHNTDKDGRATFFAPPNSQGRIRVSDLSGPQEIAQAKNLTVDFRLGDVTPAEPLRIVATDAQVELLRGAKKPAP